MTNKQITELLIKHFGFDDRMIKLVADRPGHDYRYAIDFSKIKNELNWAPTVDFTVGLAKTIEWYKNNKNWWKHLVK